MEKVYLIIQFMDWGPEVQFETTNKQKADEEFERYEGDDEALLVEVLKSNMPNYYMRSKENGSKYVKI